MLTLIIDEFDTFNDETEEFETSNATTLNLEHSLISVSKWEAKWHKPFLGVTPKTANETLDYVKCMTINNIPDIVYSRLTNDQFKMIKEYMDNPMTATVIKESKGGNREIMTNELIYYAMIANNVPMDCQKWHINRLLMLIRVCNVKAQTPKNKPKQEVLRDQAALNAARKKQLNTKG